MRRKLGLGLLGMLFVLSMTLFSGKLQSYAAVSYIHTMSEMEEYISTNGGAYDLVDESTIRLTGDFSSDNPMYVSLNDGDVTLDLNDHSMQFQCAPGIVAYGADHILHIINSGEDPSKAVISTSGSYSRTVEVSTLTVSTKMTISNVTIRNEATKSSGNTYAIEQPVKGSVLTMTDCIVESTGSCYYAIYGESAFHNCKMSTGGNYPTVLLENQGNIVIDGGTYEHTGEQAAVCLQTSAIEGDATLKILDGNFQGKEKALSISGERAIVSISGGKFSVSSSQGEPIQVLDENSSLTYSYDESLYTLVKSANAVQIMTKEEAAKLTETTKKEEETESKPSTGNTAQSKPKVVKSKPVIAKLTVGKKKLTVKMAKKVSSYYGQKYQIAYRVKGQKKWKYLTTSAQTKTIRSLKKGKKYQVKVRAYKVVKGKKYYSKWSKVKTSTKIKK